MRYIYIISFFVTIFVIEFLATATRGVESITLGWDKLNHFFAFMVLYILLSLAFRDLKTVYKVLLLFAFGLQIEIVQSFLPSREFSYLDISADIVGIMFGLLIYHTLVRHSVLRHGI
ncbi:MAG: VanZ family protein [Sulfurovaceae bacterium]|nr:VanZ family protein [Sulfurovaceae bacterium]